MSLGGNPQEKKRDKLHRLLLPNQEAYGIGKVRTRGRHAKKSIYLHPTPVVSFATSRSARNEAEKDLM